MVDSWQCYPSGPGDPWQIDSRDVSRQPKCVKRRSWPIYVSKARKDHEWNCTISSRGREILFRYSLRISISGTYQTLIIRNEEEPSNNNQIFMVTRNDEESRNEADLDGLFCRTKLVVFQSTLMWCWTTYLDKD